jgi:magnesium transporter
MQKRRHAPGAPPGTIVDQAGAGRAALRLFAYGPDACEELPLESVDAAAAHLGRTPVVWLDVVGLGDARTFTRMGEIFGLHSLALEDVVNTHQRPKMEDYGETVFIVLRMPSRAGDDLVLEQVSLFVGTGFVISIQEHVGDCLDPVRERIRRGGGRIRSESACYLAYAIVDAIVDHYFPWIEELGARLEALETNVLDEADSASVHDVYAIRHELQALRRVVWPTREAADRLARLDLAPIQPSSRVFFRDAADHLAQISDGFLGLQDLSASLMEMHLAATGNRMNEVMKVLTMIATIFIPLGFIAGLYGMNFDPDVSRWNMPELEWAYGYPMALAVMLATAVTMLAYFWRRGWWR